MSLSGSFSNVNKAMPCPVCHGTDRCSIVKSSRVVNCRTAEANEGEPRYDRGGTPYWVHHLDPAAGIFCAQAPDAPPIAAPAKLSEVYSTYLQMIWHLVPAQGLLTHHRESLLRRGFTPQEIAKRQYRTCPDAAQRKAFAKGLVQTFGEELCRKVPGLIPPKEEGGEWTIAGMNGLLVPLRDSDGNIVALKLRRDTPDADGKRYLMISSSAHGGPSALRGVHFPLDLYLDLTTVRITEGELKADFIHQQTKTNTLSLPGVNAWDKAVPALRQLERQLNESALGQTVGTVVVAFDADARRKRLVALSLKAMVDKLRECGYRVALETWNEGAGKGLDDLLLKGGVPDVLTGEAVDVEIALCLKQAGVKTIREEMGEAIAQVEAAQSLLPISDDAARLNLILDVKNDLPRDYVWFETEMDRVASFKWKMSLGRLLRVQEMERLRAQSEQESQQVDSGKPTIETYDRDVLDICRDAVTALVAANAPEELFNSGGRLVQLMRLNERLTPADLRVNDLLTRLDGCAHWVESRTKRAVYVPCPQRIAQNMLAGKRDYEMFPELRGIVQSPCFDGHGNLILTPGYQSASRLYYEPLAELALDLDGPVTMPQVKRARDWVEEHMFRTLPFANEASKAHAWALFLLPFVREMVDGPTPLHVINAPKEGTGKGLTNFVCTQPFVPGGPEPCDAPKSAEEWAKKLLGLLEKGPSHAYFDNANYRVDSQALALCLTERAYQARRLGTNETVAVPVRCVWALSGNNVEVSPEIARRSIWIDLDANCEDPSRRCYGLNLREFAAKNRATAVWAALTCVRWWLSHDRRPGEGQMGSYENWVKTIGGILAVIGVRGFLDNQRVGLDEYNSELLGWRAFASEWWQRYGDAEVKARDLAELADVLPFWEEMQGAKSLSMSFGRRLERQRNLVFLGKKITCRVVAHQMAYRLQVVDAAEHEKDVAERRQVVEGRAA